MSRKLTTEKAIALSVPILCALIERGFLPPTLCANESTLRAMIADNLNTVVQAGQMAYETEEQRRQDEAPESTQGFS